MKISLIITALLVNILGCAAKKAISSSLSSPSSSSQFSTSHRSNEEVSLDWFTDSKLKSTDPISVQEAKLFVNNVYQTLEQNIFDPTFNKELRQQNFKALVAQVEAKPTWSRLNLTRLVNNQLEKLSISHVRVFDPIEGEQLFRLFSEPSVSKDKTTATVSTQIRGQLGILRVKSFVIPQITKVAVEQALAQLSQTKALLIDLRENGGGVQSSISYLIEYIIGPDKVISTEKTRLGMALKQPYIFRGYFDDSVKNVALAEIKLSKEKNYIEYRTRLEAQKDSRPYFILVDHRCGSACEVFAAAAQEHRTAKILGVRTSGSVLGGGVFKLRWQGFILLAPISQTFSPKGNTIEGKGVEPDISIPECKNNGNQCLEKAIKLILSYPQTTKYPIPTKSEKSAKSLQKTILNSEERVAVGQLSAQ
ncbi:S41 family peptidase [Nostoc flagelliforme]|uniref:S41 family peptidase n=1 Tax=Nostoc flagelliforme TaxID=1306274 RepID=UPI001682F014